MPEPLEPEGGHPAIAMGGDLPTPGEKRPPFCKPPFCKVRHLLAARQHLVFAFRPPPAIAAFMALHCALEA